MSESFNNVDLDVEIFRSRMRLLRWVIEEVELQHKNKNVRVEELERACNKLTI